MDEPPADIEVTMSAAKPTTYRVRVQNHRTNLTAPFGDFDNANAWAMKYAMSSAKSCVCIVVASTGDEVAKHRGDGTYRIRSAYTGPYECEHALDCDRDATHTLTYSEGETRHFCQHHVPSLNPELARMGATVTAMAPARFGNGN